MHRSTYYIRDIIVCFPEPEVQPEPEPERVEPEVEPPVFVVPLKGQVAMDGDEVTMTCQVTGKPMPNISWYLNDTNIDKSEDFVITFDQNTGVTSMLIVEAFPEDSGMYKCVAINPAGEAISSAELYIEPTEPIEETVTVTQQQVVESEMVIEEPMEPPKFIQPLQPQIAKVSEDGVFSAIVVGEPVPEIKWYRDQVEMQPSEKFIMTYNPETGESRLTITKVVKEDMAIFSCKAINPAGSATSTANLVVHGQCHLSTVYCVNFEHIE